MSKFLNPLDNVSIEPQVSESNVSESGNDMESTSMNNDQYGICPKCKGPMSDVKIADNEDVIWCDKCRVSSPVKE